MKCRLHSVTFASLKNAPWIVVNWKKPWQQIFSVINVFTTILSSTLISRPSCHQSWYHHHIMSLNATNLSSILKPITFTNPNTKCIMSLVLITPPYYQTCHHQPIINSDTNSLSTILTVCPSYNKFCDTSPDVLVMIIIII